MNWWDLLLLAVAVGMGVLLALVAGRCRENEQAFAVKVRELGKARDEREAARRERQEAVDALAALGTDNATLAAQHLELAAENERLREATAVTVVETLTPDQHKTLMANICVHCGGIHTRACPRIKRIRFRADGQSVEEVEFWPDGRWDASAVKWQEDLPPVAAAE